MLAALRSNHYKTRAEFDAVVASVPDFEAKRSAASARRVEDMATLRDCYAVHGAAFGDPIPADDLFYENALAGCTGPAARTHRFVAYLDDEPVAAGNLNLYPDLGIAFFWGGGTVPHARGRGAYSAVVAARMAALKQLGVRWAGLYAKRDTSSPIVTKQGFRTIGWMTYLERPA